MTTATPKPNLMERVRVLIDRYGNRTLEPSTLTVKQIKSGEPCNSGWNQAVRRYEQLFGTYSEETTVNMGQVVEMFPKYEDYSSVQWVSSRISRIAARSPVMSKASTSFNAPLKLGMLIVARARCEGSRVASMSSIIALLDEMIEEVFNTGSVTAEQHERLTRFYRSSRSSWLDSVLNMARSTLSFNDGPVPSEYYEAVITVIKHFVPSAPKAIELGGRYLINDREFSLENDPATGLPKLTLIPYRTPNAGEVWTERGTYYLIESNTSAIQLTESGLSTPVTYSSTVGPKGGTHGDSFKFSASSMKEYFLRQDK